MRRLLKKLSSIKISELIVLIVFMPIFGTLLNSQNVNIGVTVALPQNPKMTSITVHPNLRALSIVVETIYNTQLMWLEDQETGQIIELTTDKEGYFIAALDNSNRLTQVGTHRLMALIEIVQDKTILLESKVLWYTIDNEFYITLDPASRRSTALRIQNITTDELKALQSKYQFSVLSADRYQLIKSLWTSSQKILFWFAVCRWIIYAILLLFVPYLIIARWRRKKAENKSFWSIGRGIYFQHRQPK